MSEPLVFEAGQLPNLLQLGLYKEGRRLVLTIESETAAEPTAIYHTLVAMVGAGNQPAPAPAAALHEGAVWVHESEVVAFRALVDEWNEGAHEHGGEDDELQILDDNASAVDDAQLIRIGAPDAAVLLSFGVVWGQYLAQEGGTNG